MRETYLAALEEEEFAALGGSVYVKGFLRSYAKFLGLDPEPLLAAYRAEYEREEEIQPTPHRPLAPMGPREHRGGPAVIVVAAGALLLVLAAIGLVAGGGDDGEEQTRDRGPAPVAEDEDGPGATASPRGTATPTPTPTAEPSPIDGVEVAVAVTGAISWMRVVVDGETIVEGEQEGGFSRTFTGDEVVEVRIGDASAVSLEANGADQGPLGAANEVVQVTCNAGEVECDVDVAA